MGKDDVRLCPNLKLGLDYYTNLKNDSLKITVGFNIECAII